MGYESVSEEEESDDENDQPVRFFHKYERLLKNLLVLFLYIAIGVIFMMTHEKTRFVTSLYIITQIVTTIGYGDITMKSDEGKLFMTLYVLCGIVFIAGIINDAVNSQLADQEADLRDRLLAARVSKKDGSKPTPSRWKAYKLYKLSASLTIFAFFTFSWTAFFCHIRKLLLLVWQVCSFRLHRDKLCFYRCSKEKLARGLLHGCGHDDDCWLWGFHSTESDRSRLGLSVDAIWCFGNC